MQTPGNVFVDRQFWVFCKAGIFYADNAKTKEFFMQTQKTKQIKKIFEDVNKKNLSKKCKTKWEIWSLFFYVGCSVAWLVLLDIDFMWLVLFSADFYGLACYFWLIWCWSCWYLCLFGFRNMANVFQCQYMKAAIYRISSTIHSSRNDLKYSEFTTQFQNTLGRS